MAKVGNLALATRLFEEEVGRLDVSVKDVLLVNARQAHGHTSQVQTDVGEVAKKLPVDVRLNQVIQELKHQCHLLRRSGGRSPPQTWSPGKPAVS